MRYPGLAAVAAFLLTPGLAAETGNPVAVRFWGQGLVTIETYWNLRVAIDPYALRIGYRDPRIDADLVLVTHEHFDHNNVGLIRGARHVVRTLDERGAIRNIDVVLDRLPNQDDVQLTSTGSTVLRSAHAMRVRSLAAFHDPVAGRDRGGVGMLLIEVDGVRLLHCGDLGQPLLTQSQLDLIGNLDVLLIPVGGVYTVDGPEAARITEQVRPRIVVPIHYKTAALTLPLDTADGFLDALPQRYRRVSAAGNTLAVSAGAGPSVESPDLVVLKTRPWPMPGEMTALFEAKARAAAASAAVFDALTTAQMNHRPGNGTHTPRWNAEHMMGAETDFFTAIYNRVDPSLAAMTLRPAQMPDAYHAAHTDWTGREEARQIDRIQRLTRRFAYLLADLPLDDKPPESWWTLRGLLEQMQRHYNEHTANVKQKFELPDWPDAAAP
jgi:L-ascorbate metabolism protein UlaG (beta-lactamase superfamily)